MSVSARQSSSYASPAAGSAPASDRTQLDANGALRDRASTASGGGHEPNAELATASHLFSSRASALLAVAGVDKFERAEAGYGASMRNISIVRSGSTWAWLRNASTFPPVSSSIISL
jgi:hypothetical protein